MANWPERAGASQRPRPSGPEWRQGGGRAPQKAPEMLHCRKTQMLHCRKTQMLHCRKKMLRCRKKMLQRKTPVKGPVNRGFGLPDPNPALQRQKSCSDKSPAATKILQRQKSCTAAEISWGSGLLDLVLITRAFFTAPPLRHIRTHGGRRGAPTPHHLMSVGPPSYKVGP